MDIDLHRRIVRGPAGTHELTAREAELLAWFCDHPIRPADRRELLRDVWGYRGGASTRVVDMTVRRLREKIERDPAHPEHLLTVRGVGYRFEPPERTAPPLPRRPGPLLGRRALLQALEPLEGWTTLIGPPGIGKSRLALELAWRAQERGQRVALFDPEALDPGGLSAALGAEVDLIVLDGLVRRADLPAAPPRAAVLATALQPTGIVGERLRRLGPLDRDAAEALLRARASAHHGPPAEPLGGLVEALDGLPLAIELTAPLLATVSAARLARIVETQPPALEQGTPLSRSLQASWDELPRWAQQTVAQLTVFAADFRADAAEAVVHSPQGPPVWRQLQRLCDSSWLVPSDPMRMLNATRAFAASRLPASIYEEARHRHGLWAVQLRGETALRHAPEIQVAVERALSRDHLPLLHSAEAALADIAEAFPGAAVIHSHLASARGALRQAEADLQGALDDPDPIVAVRANFSLGWLHNRQGRLDGAVAVLSRADELAGLAGLPLQRAKALNHRGLCHFELGRYGQAAVDLEAAHVLLIHHGGDSAEIARNLNGRGLLAMAQAQHDEAQILLRESLARFEALGAPRDIAWAHNNLGEVLRAIGDTAEAEICYASALSWFRAAGSADAYVPRANQALLLLADDRAAEARAIVEPILEASLRAGRRARVAVLSVVVATCRALCGEPEHAAELLVDARAAIAETGMVDLDLRAVAVQGRQAAERQRWATLEATFAQIVQSQTPL